MRIKSISLTSDKFSNDFYETSYRILSSMSEYGIDESKKYVKDLMKEKKKEYANEMHTLNNITLFYVKTESGQKFTVTYNEEIPTETTSIPETAKEYKFKN